MFNYIAAVATAVTLIIGSSPVATSATSDQRPQSVAPREVAHSTPLVRIATDGFQGAYSSGDPKPYLLSAGERRAIKRALMRSVRFVDAVA